MFYLSTSTKHHFTHREQNTSKKSCIFKYPLRRKVLEICCFSRSIAKTLFAKMDLLYFGNIFYYLILQPFKTLSGSVQLVPTTVQVPG